MRDPERLLREPPTRLARHLLAAGAAERPSRSALGRTLEAVTVVAGATTATGAAAAAMGTKIGAASATSTLASGATVAGGSAVRSAGLGIGVLAKWFGIGALGGALALPVLRVVVPERSVAKTAPHATAAVSSTRLRSSTVLHPHAPAVTAPVASRQPETHDATETRPAQTADPPRGPGRATDTLAPADSVPLEKAPVAKDLVLLAAEVRFVEQGRAALQRGAFGAALGLLAPYETEFPKQQLLTEVLFLRMEAFSRSGNLPRARALAARIITRDVAGPQAARAHEVLGL